MLFSRLLSKFILELHDKLNIEVTLGEAYRTIEQAQMNANAGSGITNSLHCIRLATDLNLFFAGKLLMSIAETESAGALWESYAVTDLRTAWGGRFSVPDTDHFSVWHNGVR